MNFCGIVFIMLGWVMCNNAAGIVNRGFGIETPGGRGGRVYRIDSLAENGPGTLREALQASGPRTIVFDVAGTIRLREVLDIEQPFVTVVGQSAPSPGITLRGAGIRVRTHDVVLQHLRIRVGDDPVGPSPRSRDGLQIIGPSAFNVVVDHLSVSWAIDENVSITQGAHDITIRDSLVSEALRNSLHPEGPHSMGVLVSEGCFRIALLRNLLAHNGERNPRIKGDTSVLVVNNLAYNSGSKNFIVIGSGDGPSRVSLVGNVFLPGPDSPDDVQAIHYSDHGSKGSRIYFLNNLLAGKPAKAPAISLDFSPPVWDPSVKIYSSMQVESLLLELAGARPWDRDAVDRRVVKDILQRSGRIIDSQEEVGGWPVPGAGHKPDF